MKVLIQNLQKQSGLATDLIQQYEPDVMLAQEINISSENGEDFEAHNTSKLGYGTAIYSRDETPTDIKLVDSPYAEFGGFIYKKTTIATVHGIQFVSFHGYNGSPFKSIKKLVAHVDAVVKVLTEGPAVFAGDFNTWSKEFLDAVTDVLEKKGFRLVFNWPYTGRDFPLDHAFTRGVDIDEGKSTYFSSASDHNGALLQLAVSSKKE